MSGMAILKLTPSCQDYLWGGSRLRTDFGIRSDLEPLAVACRLSPYSLAVLSEKQNRKKHNLTIASLAIGGILFMVGATFISS